MADTATSTDERGMISDVHREKVELHNITNTVLAASLFKLLLMMVEKKGYIVLIAGSHVRLKKVCHTKH